MNKLSSSQIIGVFLVITGMFGLQQHIEYSGWLLFFGMMGVLS